jgi:hypothetical protein
MHLHRCPDRLAAAAGAPPWLDRNPAGASGRGAAPIHQQVRARLHLRRCGGSAATTGFCVGTLIKKVWMIAHGHIFGSESAGVRPATRVGGQAARDPWCANETSPLPGSGRANPLQTFPPRTSRHEGVALRQVVGGLVTCGQWPREGAGSSRLICRNSVNFAGRGGCRVKLVADPRADQGVGQVHTDHPCAQC